mmetsp:Transcript_6217/g.13026  ORF Transcript_6217/g.13026 Transcript_6217/m.13026 type:complete len:85 (+) Transcript_6217:67-321(+)
MCVFSISPCVMSVTLKSGTLQPSWTIGIFSIFFTFIFISYYPFHFLNDVLLYICFYYLKYSKPMIQHQYSFWKLLEDFFLDSWL